MSDIPIIFYSWQSDTSKEVNRYFILDVLKTVIEYRKIECELVPRLDHDTENIPGTPDIIAAIFHKISSAAIFVADVTLVGKIKEGDKELPNPNVMLELGYAAHCLGWERIILVMNTHFGYPKNLPFDLRGRRCSVRYDLDSKNNENEIKENFAQELNNAISACLDNNHEQAMRLMPKLNHREMGFLHAFAQSKSDCFSDDENKYSYEIDHLLEKGIIFTDYNFAEQKYAYHWTYIGKLVRNLILKKNNE